MNIQIEDAATGRRITGRVVKTCPNGLCIDDARGVRFYATYDRCFTIDIFGPLLPHEVRNA